MKVVTLSLLFMVTLAGTAAGAGPVTQTIDAPEDRVWAVTESVLKHQGWEIEKSERAIGWITTRSRMVEGEDYGVYAKGSRHLLRIFNRERILWMDKDEPLVAKDQDVEKRLLEDIRKSL